jgi:hypothetical protein
MRSLSDSISSITKQTFSRKYIALGRIADHWSDIVGADLADKAQPSAIKYRRHKDEKKKPDAILEIATTSAYATRLHYQIDLILERINTIFGDRWVTGIKFVNVPANTQKPPKRLKTEVLNAQDEDYLQQILDSVSDNEVKTRLKSFGAAMLLDQKAQQN